MKDEFEAVIIGTDHTNILSVIRGLGREKRSFFAVIVCDGIPKTCIKSKYLKDFVVCKKNEILENLYQIGKKLEHKVPIISCCDPSAFIIDKNLTLLSKYFHCHSIAMHEGEICRMMDKYVQYLFAQKFKIEMAKTYVILLNEMKDTEYEYPLILKPRVSAFGNKGDICMVNNQNELYKAVERLAHEGYEEVLAQNYIDIDYECTYYGVVLGPESYTCNGVRKILRWPRIGGSAAFAVTIEPSNLIKQVLQHMGEMGYVGMYDIEMFVKDGKFILNEMNFRHTGLGYVELSNGINSGQDLIDYFNGCRLREYGTSKKIYSINSRLLIGMLKAGEVSVFDFVKAELISKSHSIFVLDDPMPGIKAMIDICLNKMRKMMRHH